MQVKLLLRVPAEVSIPARTGTPDRGYLAFDDAKTLPDLQGKLPELRGLRSQEGKADRIEVEMRLSQ